MKNTNAQPLPGLEIFATRDIANTGHKLPLSAPDGTETAHWIQVRGVDSDPFKIAENRQNRRVAEIVALEGEERELALLDAALEMQVALVADWSFSDKELMGEKAIPCTPEKVKAFLHTAPQIAREIDKFASKRNFFFSAKAANLLPTPKQPSDSQGQPQKGHQ